MDPTKFDEFTKVLATQTSRRQALKAVAKAFAATALGTLLAQNGIGVASATNCQPLGHNCGADEQCCSHFCDHSTHVCGCPFGTTQCGSVCCNGCCAADGTCGTIINGQCCPASKVCNQPSTGLICCPGNFTCCGDTCCDSILNMCCIDNAGRGRCCLPGQVCCSVSVCCLPGQTCVNGQFCQ
jgi:hypothetical protein